MHKKQILASLPQYFGGKRSLLCEIFKELEAIYPRSEWEDLVFLDLFRGGGAVSLYAKLCGFKQLISNDISHRSNIVGKGLLQNSHSIIQPYHLMDLLNLKPEGIGRIESQYASDVFSTRHAQRLDQLDLYIGSITTPEIKALFQLLMWKLITRYVAYGTSIGTSNRNCAKVLDNQDLSLLQEKRITDGTFQKLLRPTLSDLLALVEEINNGVFPALGEVTCYQEDTLELLPKISGDIAYFDPPYAQTTGYERSNQVLDSVLFGDTYQSLPVSSFTSSIEALKTMLDLSQHIPLWILSYNNTVCELDELMNLVKEVAPQRTITGKAIAYQHMQHVSKRNNFEFIVTASKG